MQRVLCFRINKKFIVSKPWDFEAMCLIDDQRENGINIEACKDALYYLFEGTEVTDEVIEKIPPDIMFSMLKKLFIWYLSDVKLITGKSSNTHQKNSGVKLRDIYREMFKAWGILPSEIGKNAPKDIFGILSSENKAEIPSELKELYGI